MASIVSERHKGWLSQQVDPAKERYRVEFGRAAMRGLGVALDLESFSRVLYADFRVILPAAGWVPDECLFISDNVLTKDAITVQRAAATMGDVEFDFYVVGIAK